jgi:hypothetical protein
MIFQSFPLNRIYRGLNFQFAANTVSTPERNCVSQQVYMGTKVDTGSVTLKRSKLKNRQHFSQATL